MRLNGEKCPNCGAFIAACGKCGLERRSLSLLPITPSPGKPAKRYHVSISEIIAWVQRREARAQSTGIEDFVADLREGRL